MTALSDLLNARKPRDWSAREVARRVSTLTRAEVADLVASWSHAPASQRVSWAYPSAALKAARADVRYPAKTGPDGYDEFWAANASGRDDKGMDVTVTVYYSPTPTTEHGETA